MKWPGYKVTAGDPEYDAEAAVLSELLHVFWECYREAANEFCVPPWASTSDETPKFYILVAEKMLLWATESEALRSTSRDGPCGDAHPKPHPPG